MSGTYEGDRRGEPRGPDRRRARRVPARLEVRLTLGTSFLDAERGDSLPALELYGYTRDLGGGGLGVVISSVTFDLRACAGGYPLRVALLSERGLTELTAEVVHCRPLGEQEPAEGVVLGARFTGAGLGAEDL